MTFLSTLSLRRATGTVSRLHSNSVCFYPRSPCGERPRGEHHANSQQEFLSTLSLRRATLKTPCVRLSIDVFLSTLSLRRATLNRPPPLTSRASFYPRSPCGERRVDFSFFVLYHCFYPRSPCGERPPNHSLYLHNRKFLSTLSLRRATYCCPYLSSLTRVSIHALLAESDKGNEFQQGRNGRFYPRSPCGERPSSVRESLSGSTVSIHALLAESDGKGQSSGAGICKFLSTLSLRRATVKLFRQNYECFVSIHALLAESDTQANILKLYR